MGSDTFDFLVGSEGNRYTLHRKLVAHHSEPLNVLINGSMSEAKQNFAVLKDVDEDTFVRFCQYAYTGAYDDVVADGTADSDTPSKNLEIEATPGILLPNRGF